MEGLPETGLPLRQKRRRQLKRPPLPHLLLPRGQGVQVSTKAHPLVVVPCIRVDVGRRHQKAIMTSTPTRQHWRTLPSMTSAEATTHRLVDPRRGKPMAGALPAALLARRSWPGGLLKALALKRLFSSRSPLESGKRAHLVGESFADACGLLRE